MYFDTKPCRVCGAEIRLRARLGPVQGGRDGTDGPVGEPDGVVGDADSTVDERVCANPDCPTNRADRPAGDPAP